MTVEIVARTHRGFRIAVFKERRGYVAYVARIDLKHRDGRNIRFGPYRTCELVLEVATSAIDVGFVH